MSDKTSDVNDHYFLIRALVTFSRCHILAFATNSYYCLLVYYCSLCVTTPVKEFYGDDGKVKVKN